MSVRFVRVLRQSGMKYGFAVDDTGRRWRGFFASTAPEVILHTANLHDVGICCSCRGRVFSGWECMDKSEDLCDWCARMPPNDKVFVTACTKSKFDSVLAAFFCRPSFVLNKSLREK